MSCQRPTCCRATGEGECEGQANLETWICGHFALSNDDDVVGNSHCLCVLVRDHAEDSACIDLILRMNYK